MEPYMIIYRTEEHWPITGMQTFQGAHYVSSIDIARVYKADLIELYSETLTDVQIYEYTGIQYVLVERWHKDA